MTYQALARKWRPQTFVDLLGQEVVVKALTNALRENRIAQAYLFAGIRGVGKTTAARVLAKALNCLGPDGAATGPVTDPCRAPVSDAEESTECDACRGVREGSDLDVLEIDAATHSKVEQARELTESLAYGPAQRRYKVVILDEVHRLSLSAFDALLKIVEEPPDRLAFIFATTEIEKVPATILSRCQEFNFQRVPAAPLAGHLRKICGQEEIETGEAALFQIAQASGGSVRDAVALLDQLATFGGGKLEDDDVRRFLGRLDAGQLTALLGAVLEGNGAEVSNTIRSLEDHGNDPGQVFTSFLGHLRSALHLAQGMGGEQLGLSDQGVKALLPVAAGAGYQNLLRLLHLLLGSETVVRRADAPGLALEVALLRAAELPRLVSIEQLAGALPVAAEGAAEPGARAAAAAVPPPEHVAAPPPPQAGASVPAPAVAAASDAAGEFERILGASHPSLSGLLGAHKARFAVQGSTLVITASAALEEALRRDDRKAGQLRDVARRVLGPEADWKMSPVAQPQPDAQDESGKRGPATPAASGPAADAVASSRRATRRREQDGDARSTDVKATGAKGPSPKPQASSRRQPAPAATRRALSSNEAARTAAEANPTVRAVLDIFGGRVLEAKPREQ